MNLCHYESTGSGEPAVAFTHGLAATGATWRAQVEETAAHRRALTWDLRGHGRSPSPAGPYILADLARDLAAVLDHAGIERAVVVGHSAGGVVAIRFALDFPDRTAGLVLVGTASECNARANQFYEDLANLAEQGNIAAVRKRLGLASDPAPPQFEGNGFAKVARCMGNLYYEPLTADVGKIYCPALIVVGEKDFLGAGGSVILSRKIAGSELHIVPGRGHGIFLEDPAGFNRLLSSFLSRLDGKRE